MPGAAMDCNAFMYTHTHTHSTLVAVHSSHLTYLPPP